MTDGDPDSELLARLRAADPVAPLPPADPARVARLLEEAMSTDLDADAPTREQGTRGRNSLTWLVAAAAVLLAVGVGGFVLLQDDPDAAVPGGPATAATITTLRAPAGITSGRCLVPDARTVRAQELAFDGTVAEVGADVVTLEPSRFYTGAETDLVEVQAPPEELASLVGAPQFEVGARYLVSATGGEVTLCGLSGPWSEELAALYAEAFPS